MDAAKKILIISILILVIAVNAGAEYFQFTWGPELRVFNPIKGFNVKIDNLDNGRYYFQDVGKANKFSHYFNPGDQYRIRVIPYSASGSEGDPVFDFTGHFESQQSFTIY